MSDQPVNINHEALEREVWQITRNFAEQLRHIRDLLVTDLQAAYEGDPAAHSVSEILLCYPGMTAIIYYRFAHALHNLGALFLARLISSIAHSTIGGGVWLTQTVPPASSITQAQTRNY